MTEYPRRLSEKELEKQRQELQQQDERVQKDYEENVRPKIEALAREKAVRRHGLEQSGELTSMTNEEIEGIAEAYATDLFSEGNFANLMGSLENATYWRDPKTGEGFSRSDDYDRVRDAFKKQIILRLDSFMEKWKHQS